MSELLFTNKSDLVAIADSIRNKAGISGSLSFPQGFIDSINGISGQGGSSGGSSGGSNSTLEDKVYDYYGMTKEQYPSLFIWYYPKASNNNVGIVRSSANIFDNNATRIEFQSGTYGHAKIAVSENPTCEEIVNATLEAFPTFPINKITSDSSGRKGFSLSDSSIVAISNFDVVSTTPTKYRLDQVEEETLPYDGLENGYDVTFYDEYGEKLAFYSVKQGHTIEKPPKYDCVSWQTTDGIAISFPYVPTADISVYANNDTLASVLYKHFNIDPVVYPYLAVGITAGGTYCGIMFGKSVGWNYSSLAMWNGYWFDGHISALSSIDGHNGEEVVSTIYQNRATINTASEMWGIKNQSSTILYCNFDPTEFSNVQTNLMGGVYRLDEVTEQLPYDGLANGYDVMFYDENNEGLAFYSIKQGAEINAPTYAVSQWETSNGVVVEFPFTPTSDIVLYAKMTTFADLLYEHYAMDKTNYPYLYVGDSGDTRGFVIFCKNVSKSGTSLRLANGYFCQFKSDAYETDLSTLIHNIINEGLTLENGGTNTIMNVPPAVHCFRSNFNPLDFGFDVPYADLNQ